MAQPPLKWAGGKRQILDEIRACLPPETRVESYHEPFFGGGAVFFEEVTDGTPGSINDINARLMNFYRQVRDNPDDLITFLESFERPDGQPDTERAFSTTNRKGKQIESYYYQQRELYNNRPNDDSFDPIEEAALLMYLNRTCYNGLYRENQSGEFNAPIGRPATAEWALSNRIRAASKALRRTTINDGDFAYVLEAAGRGDLVYFDPPYKPVSQSASFTQYSSDGFDTDQQKRLCQVATELYENGVNVVVSNSPPMKELYNDVPGFTIHEIGATRQINSDADSRGEVGEIIATTVPETNRRTQLTSLDQFTPIN